MSRAKDLIERMKKVSKGTKAEEKTPEEIEAEKAAKEKEDKEKENKPEEK